MPFAAYPTAVVYRTPKGDAVTGDPVAVHQNRVTLSMPAKRLRLVAVGEGR